jgi:hypothetical protein
MKYRADPHGALAVTLRDGRFELTPLELAAYHGDRWTIEAIMDIADKGAIERALKFAIENKHARSARFILNHDRERAGKAGNASGISPEALTAAAALAARAGHTDVLAVLADRGVDLNSGSPSPPICAAIESDQAESIRLILDRVGRSSLSARCADGLSPLGFATRLGRKRATSVLEEAGGR